MHVFGAFLVVQSAINILPLYLFKYKSMKCTTLTLRFVSGDNVRGDVRLEDGKFPEVFLDGTWSPICGHHFWDTDFGAQLFCQKLFSNNASTGQVIRTDKALEKNAIRIGKCLSNDTWLSCSGGCNDLGTGQGCSEDCDANSPYSIEIKCSHGKKYYKCMYKPKICTYLGI